MSLLVLTGCASVIAQVYGTHPAESQQMKLQDINPHHYGSYSGRGGIHMSFVRPLFETLVELEEDAAIIVRGRMGNDARIVLNRGSSPRTHNFMGSNRVSLEVLEVIRGDISVGDIITIQEPYFIRNGLMFSPLDYAPSMPYQEYIFFLLEGEVWESETVPYYDSEKLEYELVFPVMEGSRGRFPILNNAMHVAQDVIKYGVALEAARGTNSYEQEELIEKTMDAFQNNEIRRYADSHVYMSLFQDVMNAFLNN